MWPFRKPSRKPSLHCPPQEMYRIDKLVNGSYVTYLRFWNGEDWIWDSFGRAHQSEADAIAAIKRFVVATNGLAVLDRDYYTAKGQRIVETW